MIFIVCIYKRVNLEICLKRYILYQKYFKREWPAICANMNTKGMILSVHPSMVNLTKLCTLLSKSSTKVTTLPSKNQKGKTKIAFAFNPTKE